MNHTPPNIAMWMYLFWSIPSVFFVNSLPEGELYRVFIYALKSILLIYVFFSFIYLSLGYAISSSTQKRDQISLLLKILSPLPIGFLSAIGIYEQFFPATAPNRSLKHTRSFFQRSLGLYCRLCNL